MDEEIRSLLKCKVEPRGWGGYLLDILTMGGNTAYRTFEYTKCIQKDHRNKVEAIRRLTSSPSSPSSQGGVSQQTSNAWRH
jgi:hypothetical protein